VSGMSRILIYRRFLEVQRENLYTMNKLKGEKYLHGLMWVPEKY
jgi:hypothetical protein